MTLPAIPDLTLYQTLVDFFYARLKRHEVKHAYFQQATIHAAQDKPHEPEGAEGAADYNTIEPDRFAAWLLFDEYRRQLVLDQVFPFFVTFDISNFFDTILHSRLAESLHRAGGSPETVGLLFFLIERLSIRREYTDSPRIGLPVDEFDCSRKLAHIFLFGHDKRVVAKIGSEAYVRWMDDQILGVNTRSEALRVIGFAADSLARLYLTPNAAKCRVLSLHEATLQFQLEANAALREAETLCNQKKPRKARQRLRYALSVGNQGEASGRRF